MILRDIKVIFHPSIFLCSSNSGSQGGWVLSQLLSGRRWATPLMDRQSVTGLTLENRQLISQRTFTHSVDVKSVMTQTWMSLDCGRKPDYLEHTQAPGEHENTQRRTCAFPGNSGNSANLYTVLPSAHVAKCFSSKT